jgi:APA family basic amino acid/polyamine antiporter
MDGAAEPKTGKLGLVALTALVVGNMVGSGIFMMPRVLAPLGATSVLAWVASASGSLAFGLVIANLARRMPVVGGPYAYTREAFGEFAAFLVGWGYWISCWQAQAAIAVSMVAYLGELVPFVAAHPMGVALATIVVLAAVNVRGVREAGAVQVATTVLKVLPLAAVTLLGFARFEPAHFRPFNPVGEGLPFVVLSGLALTLWAFQGFESASIAAHEARDARRNVPRATLLGIGLATVLYVASTLAVMGLLPREALARSTAPFADAAGVLWGDGARRLVALGAFVSCFGALNGWILVAGRLPLAIARDGLFPPFFARVTGRGTPGLGIVLSSALACLLIGLRYAGASSLVTLFQAVSVLATLSALVPFVFCALAELKIADRERRAGGSAHPTMTIVALLAFGYGLVTIAGAGVENVSWGLLLLIGGIPFYFLGRARGTP